MFKPVTFRDQTPFLHVAVQSVWSEMSMGTMTGKELVMGGDGRNDSMSHSAKYGTYILMDLDSNKVIDVKTVQVCGCCHH